MKKIAIFLLLLCSLQADDASYELGKGLQVGFLPFYIGGYFSLDYKNMNNENRYRADDIAIMGYGSYNKFSYMMEFEYKGFYAQTYKGDSASIIRDTQLHKERIYIDYNFDENYMFRVGKFSSPIGYWNLLPVNVLRQTTSNPISSDIIFPKLTTGIGITYSSFNDAEIKLDLMLQNTKDIDDSYNNYKIKKHYGVGLSYENDDYSFKVNAGYYQTILKLSEIDHDFDDGFDQDNLYYFLLSGKYETDKYQLQGEVGYQQSDKSATAPYAGYLQGVYNFTQQHIAILRVESYDNKVTNINDDIAILGYTYRPSYPIAIKSEYQFHSIEQENQFLFSVSVMF